MGLFQSKLHDFIGLSELSADFKLIWTRKVRYADIAERIQSVQFVTWGNLHQLNYRYGRLTLYSKAGVICGATFESEDGDTILEEGETYASVERRSGLFDMKMSSHFSSREEMAEALWDTIDRGKMNPLS